jgi:hypothetical protein
MPKFLRIGVHQSNVSGYTSKAWWVRRVGSTIFLKWGAVEVHGVGDGRKVYWTLSPQAKTIRCGTVQRAKDYAKAAIARRRSHRYEPLAGSIAIRRAGLPIVAPSSNARSLRSCLSISSGPPKKPHGWAIRAGHR